MSRRIDKFEKKLDGEIRGRLFDEQKEMMVAKEKIAIVELVETEVKTKGIVDGEPVILLPYYIIFAKECVKLRKKYIGWPLSNEIEIREEKWRMRGLDPNLLNDIKVFFVPAYEFMAHFRLDISKLDGPHILS